MTVCLGAFTNLQRGAIGVHGTVFQFVIIDERQASCRYVERCAIDFGSGCRLM
jgi:hypothetical protein